MRLVDILPDATPAPGARQRVRAGIRARVERARRRTTAAVFGAIAAAAAIAMTIALLRQDRGVHEPAEAARSVRLSTGVVELAANARLFVGAGSEVSLVRDDAVTIVRLDRGELLARVAKRAPGHAFVVLAGDVRVEVVGTVFAVAISSSGNVGVRGFEGSVRVSHDGSDARVGAGEVWPSVALAPAIDDAALRALGFVTAAAPPPPPSPDPPPAPPPPTVTPRPRPRPYVIARRLEEAGDIDRAIAAYRAITIGSDAEDALYAVGRLQLARDPDEARATFATYRARYPHGRYDRAVALHVLDLAIARRDAAAIDAEATRFLADHPDDPLAGRFRRARAAAGVTR